MNILVVDVGGTHVKVLASGQKTPVRIASGPEMTARVMTADVLKATVGWKYDAVSIGYPGPVLHNQPLLEPHNLARGWSLVLAGAGSIAGNGPHNPFLDGTAMFTLDVPGVTSATTVTSAIFSFGTSSDCDLCTAPGTPRNNPTVPEPGTYVMIAVGLGLVGLAQLRRSKATR